MMHLARRSWRAIASFWRNCPKPAKGLRTYAAFFIASIAVLWLFRAPIALSQLPDEAIAPAESGSFGLVSSEPANEATDILVDSDVYLRFSQPLGTEFEELQLTFTPEVELSFATQDDYLVLQPFEQWDYSTEYAIEIPPQPALPLVEPLQFTFKTEPQYTYNRDVKPLLDTSCIACHQPAGRQRRSPLNSYDTVLKYVQPGEAGSTLLDPKWTGRHARIRQTGRSIEFAYARANNISIEKIVNGWSPEEVDIVRTWIVQDRAVQSTTARQ
ncbi:MAG: Ig-like domain-containing protein [Cyanobacteria bacterium J06642_2]